MQTQFETLVDLAQAVEDEAKKKHDFIADTSHLTLRDDGNVLAAGAEGDTFQVDAHCHRQIGARLGIPSKYYDKMRKEIPDLLADNVNAWFRKRPEKRMVRTLAGTARAFLSDRFQRIDNIDILQGVFPVLQEVQQQHPIAVRSCALTSTKMHLKLTVPEIKGEVGVGDICEAGFDFRNGEIGNSMFEGSPFVYRLICLNGMRTQDGSIKKMHVGARADIGDASYEALTDETLKLDDRVLMLKARDLVNYTLRQENFDKLLGHFREAAGEKIEGNPAKAIEVLAHSNGLTDDEQGSVLRHLIEGGDLSKWGVANAVTRTAQDIEDYDRADDFVGLGGKVVDLAANQWSEIAIAA